MKVSGWMAAGYGGILTGGFVQVLQAVGSTVIHGFSFGPLGMVLIAAGLTNLGYGYVKDLVIDYFNKQAAKEDESDAATQS